MTDTYVIESGDEEDPTITRVEADAIDVTSPVGLIAYRENKPVAGSRNWNRFYREGGASK